MASPVWLDGPLQGAEHPVTEEEIEQGSYAFLSGSLTGGSPPEYVVYTFTIVQVLGREVVVASALNIMLHPDNLAPHLLSAAALAASR